VSEKLSLIKEKIPRRTQNSAPFNNGLLQVKIRTYTMAQSRLRLKPLLMEAPAHCSAPHTVHSSISRLDALRIGSQPSGWDDVF
jgi:hypothetical protein